MSRCSAEAKEQYKGCEWLPCGDQYLHRGRELTPDCCCWRETETETETASQNEMGSCELVRSIAHTLVDKCAIKKFISAFVL